MKLRDLIDQQYARHCETNKREALDKAGWIHEAFGIHASTVYAYISGRLPAPQKFLAAVEALQNERGQSAQVEMPDGTIKTFGCQWPPMNIAPYVKAAVEIGETTTALKYTQYEVTLGIKNLSASNPTNPTIPSNPTQKNKTSNPTNKKK